MAERLDREARLRAVRALAAQDDEGAREVVIPGLGRVTVTASGEPEPVMRAAPVPVRVESPLEYDDSLGGLIPSISAQITPGSEARGVVLPETEDWEAYGDAPAAAVLSEPAIKRRKHAELSRVEDINREERDFEARERVRGRLRELGEEIPLARGFDTVDEVDPVTAATRRAEALGRFAENDARRAREADLRAERVLEGVPSRPAAVLGGVLQGVTQSGGDEGLGLLDSLLRGNNYEESRDQFRALSDEAEANDPAAFNLARLGGAIGSGFLMPTSAAARSATLGGAVARGAATGAGWGGLAGFLDSEAEDAPGTLRDAAESGAIGAAVGGPLGALGHGIGRAADYIGGLAPRMRGEAARQRLAALGATKADIEAAERHFPGGVEGLAETFRQMGLTGTARTPQSFEQLAQEALRRAGSEMGDVLSTARVAQEAARAAPADVTLAARPSAYRSAAVESAAGTRIPTDEFMAQVYNDVVSPLSRGTTNTSQGQARAMEQWLERVAGLYPDGIGVDELQGLKRELQDAIFTNRRDPTAGATSQAYNTLQRQTKGMLDRMLDDVGSRINRPELARDFQGARQRYQAAALADEWVGNALNRGSANNVMQPLAEIHAAAGSAGGNPVGGVLMGIGRQLLRNRQHSLAATALEGTARRAPGAVERARVLTETLRARGVAPAVGEIGSSLTATRQPDAPGDELEQVAPEQADPNALSDSDWLEMAEQPQINPDALSDEEWLQMEQQ